VENPYAMPVVWDKAFGTKDLFGVYGIIIFQVLSGLGSAG